MAKAPKANPFPFILYVKKEEDGATSFFVADVDMESMVGTGERVEIAKYTRSDVVTAKGVVEVE